MSFWARIKGVKIEDLDVFQEMCRRHGVRYEHNEDANFKMNGAPVVATLHDEKGRSHAYLVESGGAIMLEIDNDANYSSLTKRLGKNGGKLTRDYTEGMVEQRFVANGGIVNSVEEQSDGSLVMRIGTL